MSCKTLYLFILVLKSDYANGQFGFQISSCSSQLKESQTTANYTIERRLGTFGIVTVTWEIRQVFTGRPIASQDFSQTRGTVVFNQGETEKVSFVS